MTRNFQWIKPPSRAWSLTRARDFTMDQVTLVMHMYAVKIERDMKLEALWTDRTGNARQTLFSWAARTDPNWAVLVAAQYMSYGVYLEGVRKDGKPMTRQSAGYYRIVMPTLSAHLKGLFAEIRQVIGG